ncbi:MAG TPA: prepilin-type N-terminal cleavage/methylation domain-containing protein [Chthoniobacterales bacterium]|jgi:prepilin-type N-terminal cleavage/methylation domain-containing protein
MLSLSRKPQRDRFARCSSALRAGFTIVEVIVGITILGMTAGAAIWGLNQLNYYAGVNRLYTAAQTLAQNQIDLILTMGPYDPAQGSYPLPSTCGNASNTNSLLQVNADGTPSTYWWDPTVSSNTCPKFSAARDVVIYKDPMNDNQIVTGRIATTISTTPFAVNGTSLDVRQATVRVSYTYRRRNYEVVMETLRTSDK